MPIKSNSLTYYKKFEVYKLRKEYITTSIGTERKYATAIIIVLFGF